jgi:hypothetical protein
MIITDSQTVIMTAILLLLRLFIGTLPLQSVAAPVVQAQRFNQYITKADGFQHNLQILSFYAAKCLK